MAGNDIPQRGLFESERRFRLLVEGVVDYAIYMLDPEGIVSNWNAGAKRIKGYDAGDVVGQHFGMFYLPEDREAGMPARSLAAARQHGRFEAEGWRLRKDGSRFLASVVIRDHIKSGKLRGLGVAGPTRVSIVPDVSTMAEAGYPAIEATGWNGIFVAAGTPPAVGQRLHQEIAAILRSKEMQDDAVNLGSELGGERPEEFAAFVRSEIRKWGKVIKDAGIKIE